MFGKVATLFLTRGISEYFLRKIEISQLYFFDTQLPLFSEIIRDICSFHCKQQLINMVNFKGSLKIKTLNLHCFKL